MTAVQRHLPCVHCGNPLEALTPAQICSRCGRPVGQMYNVRAVDEATGTIALDVICTTCGYDLKTLPVGTVCPECGQPVASSLRRDGLHFASLSWLRRMRLGLALLVACYSLSLATLCVLAGIDLAGLYRPGDRAQLAYHAPAWGALLCWVAAVYLLTRPEDAFHLSGTAALPKWTRRITLAYLVTAIAAKLFPLASFLWVSKHGELWQIGLFQVLEQVPPLAMPQLLLRVIAITLSAAAWILLLTWLRIFAWSAGLPGERAVLGFLVAGTLLQELLDKAAFVVLYLASSNRPIYDTVGALACAGIAGRCLLNLTGLIVCIRLINAVGQAIARHWEFA